MVYEIEDMSQLAHLFQGWQETLIWSCLDGSMGRAFAAQRRHPVSGRIITADFSFFAG